MRSVSLIAAAALLWLAAAPPASAYVEFGRTEVEAREHAREDPRYARTGESAATERDASTARLGESFYAFLLRTLWQQLAESYLFERHRLRSGKWFDVRNRIVQDIALMILAYGGLALAWGWWAALFLAVESAVGIVVLEFVDHEPGAPHREQRFSEKLACPNGHALAVDDLEPRSFSFNSPYGACPECTGLGIRKEVDPDLVVPDPELTLAQGAVAPWSMGHTAEYFTRMMAGLGDAPRAARLAGAADAIRQESGLLISDQEAAMVEELLAPARAAAPRQVWEAEIAAGRALTYDDAITLLCSLSPAGPAPG